MMLKTTSQLPLTKQSSQSCLMQFMKGQLTRTECFLVRNHSSRSTQVYLFRSFTSNTATGEEVAQCERSFRIPFPLPENLGNGQRHAEAGEISASPLNTRQEGSGKGESTPVDLAGGQLAFLLF